MSIADFQLDEKPSGLDSQPIFTVLSVTVLAFTAIQSHLYISLTNTLFCTSLQWPPQDPDSSDPEEPFEVLKSMGPRTHALVPLTYGDVTLGVSHNTCTPASLI